MYIVEPVRYCWHRLEAVWRKFYVVWDENTYYMPVFIINITDVVIIGLIFAI